MVLHDCAHAVSVAERLPVQIVHSTVMLVILTSYSGNGCGKSGMSMVTSVSAERLRACTLSFLSQRTPSMSCMTFIPAVHRPNMVCLLSNQGVGTTVMKNWD